jgi:hypothetical protein
VAGATAEPTGAVLPNTADTVVAKGPGVTLSDLGPYLYDGTPKPATVVTDPPGLSVEVTYDGAPTAPTAAGTYEVVATVTAAPCASATGELEISPRGLIVGADAASKRYGTPDPELTYHVVSGSLAAGDAFTGALDRESGEGVGEYDILQGTLTAGASYDLSYVGEKLTIYPWTSASGDTATGTGQATARFTGGGAACTFEQVDFVSVAEAGARPPTVFPHGLISFTLVDCTEPVAMTETFPSELPAGSAYWKYGPTRAGARSTWYQFLSPALAATDVFTLTLEDGAPGDDDLTVNRRIVGLGGPGEPLKEIPTLGLLGLLAFAVLTAAAGSLILRR